MAKLNAAARKKLSSKTFGLPKQRKYPMPDANHAKVAKSYASKEVKAGKLSASQKAKIDAKANSVIKRSGGTPTVMDRVRSAMSRSANR